MTLASKITLSLGLVCLALAIINLVRGEIPWEGALAALLLFVAYRRERLHTSSPGVARRP
jgi:hypothetical protein